MLGIRSVPCRLRHLKRLSPFCSTPGSSLRPAISRRRRTCVPTFVPARLQSFLVFLTPPSIAGARTAASGHSHPWRRPKCEKQRASEFWINVGPVQDEEGTGETTLCRPCLFVSIQCCKRDVGSLSEALLCFGAASVSMEELSDISDADEVCITSIFTNDQDVHKCISSAAMSIGLDKTPNYEVTVSEDYDWISNVKETFNPVQVTNGLWIVPEWRTPPDLDATNIILNPGIAFGTGEHPTTKLCLVLLHKLVKGGENFLDYGTGSGILGIAALKITEVKEKYSEYLESICITQMDGWACLSGIKRSEFGLSFGGVILSSQDRL